MMAQMSNTFAARFGPAPFSELVSEIQHRCHADRELMYLSATEFYGRTNMKSFSAFDDPQGYAGSPPSVPYLKGLFTDNVSAYRIFIERFIASLSLTVAAGDHTFQVSLACRYYEYQSDPHFISAPQVHGGLEGGTALHRRIYTSE
jgi:hypothetical protein